MASDEREIRTVHSIWIDAVNAGDLARLLTLVAEDVVFLTPGQAPIGREGFSSNFKAAHEQMRICCTSELEEVSTTTPPHPGVHVHVELFRCDAYF
jgi:uncharacterized protein (TIGR02246 family)